MRVEAGRYRCEGTNETIHADQPLSREQVDLIVAVCEQAGKSVHDVRAVEFDEGSQSVEWWHRPSAAFYTTTLAGHRVIPARLTLTLL